PEMSNPLTITDGVSLWNAYSVSPESVFAFELPERTQIEMTGEDRVTFLHGFCTSEIKRLKPGDGCETFLTNIKGKVVGHVFVFVTETSLWLDTVPKQSDSIIKHLDRYLIREDVQFVDRSNEFGELYITGPHVASLLLADDLREKWTCRSRESFGNTYSIRRVDLFGHPGFLISGTRSWMQAMIQNLTAVGCVAGSSDLWESLRIAAGFPSYGVDITDDTIAQEVARTSSCISFTKGCYLGQEPIARLDALGHTNRELRRLMIAGQESISSGAAVKGVDSDDEAGVITSVAPLATSNGDRAALGLLRTRFTKPGTQLRIVCGDFESSAVVQGKGIDQ
ncbi:MAG: folate-binding protein YgfZ, partial [Planctomycetes bacterium]|nr:folate-binding protein YgfZ [Planctomycetota bacterium]